MSKGFNRDRGDSKITPLLLAPFRNNKVLIGYMPNGSSLGCPTLALGLNSRAPRSSKNAPTWVLCTQFGVPRQRPERGSLWEFKGVVCSSVSKGWSLRNPTLALVMSIRGPSVFPLGVPLFSAPMHAFPMLVINLQDNVPKGPPFRHVSMSSARACQKGSPWVTYLGNGCLAQATQAGSPLVFLRTLQLSIRDQS